MRILLLLSLIMAVGLTCEHGFCDRKDDGWYCCFGGDSAHCQNGKIIYTDICPRGCEIGYCLPGAWCELTTPSSKSEFCNITYPVDRQTDFVTLDLKAEELYNTWTSNSSAGNCSSDLYQLVACNQVYKPCDDPGMKLCNMYSSEAAECDDRISPKDCVWSNASGKDLILAFILWTLLIVFVY